MSKLKLDLHDIFNKGKKIEDALASIMNDAVKKKIKTVEIIPGKGSGQLKKKVIKFLEKNKGMYHRIEKDSHNWGRLFVHFKHN
ncbi:MAG: Smr/MutS family protein [Candidatus Ancaeobacter aquaticus]|nr:Smr/MutS family protein [Candidatus Ancaeobacter aquaticus]